MKRNILSLLIVTLALCVSVQAQTAVKSERDVQGKQKPAGPMLTPEQQQQLAHAVANAQTEQLQAEAAKARADRAQALVQAMAFRVMALLKVSPEEYDLRPAEEGGFIFVKKAGPPAAGGAGEGADKIKAAP